MATASGLVKALYVGVPAQLTDKTQLIPGETVAEIPAGEAVESANWNPIEDVDPLKGLKKDELLQVAAERNIDVPDDATAPAIKKLILDALETGDNA